MVIKGTVERIVDSTRVKVRVLEYDGVKGASNSTKTDDLADAYICTSFGEYPNIQVGDIVFVAYEKRKVQLPIVVGKYFTATVDKKELPNYYAQDITSLGNVTLPKSTTIGSITSKEIGYLQGSKDNLQTQLDNIILRLKVLEEAGGPNPYVNILSYKGKYDGSTHTVSIISSNGTLTYSSDGETYQETIPTFTDVGIYTVWIKATKNNTTVTVSGTVNIIEAEEWGFVSNTVASTYSGSPQSIIVTAFEEDG